MRGGVADHLQAFGRIGVDRLKAITPGGNRRRKIKQALSAAKRAGSHNGLELFAAQGFLEHGGHTVASLPLNHLPFHTDFHEKLLSVAGGAVRPDEKPKQNGEVNLPTAPIPVIRPSFDNLCYGRGQGRPPLRGINPKVSFGRNEQT